MPASPPRAVRNCRSSSLNPSGLTVLSTVMTPMIWSCCLSGAQRIERVVYLVWRSTPPNHRGSCATSLHTTPSPVCATHPPIPCPRATRNSSTCAGPAISTYANSCRTLSSNARLQPSTSNNCVAASRITVTTRSGSTALMSSSLISVRLCRRCWVCASDVAISVRHYHSDMVQSTTLELDLVAFLLPESNQSGNLCYWKI